MSADALRSLSAVALRDAVASGECSAVEAAQAYLDAIDAHDGQLRAFLDVHAARALDRARAVDAGEATGPLAGVPVAVKDNMTTTFGRTTCASRYLEYFNAPYTATAVERLESAGAVILGKTNMDEFAMGSSNENSSFAPAANPWDTSRVPGGSSGGSAAAVAGRLAAAAVGSDTGGSIRQPAGFCGCVGLKPTYGRVSRYGLVAFGSSLDQIGPLTRDVRDAALLLGVLAGHDPRDATSLPGDVPDYLAALDAPADNLTVGLPKQFFNETLGGAVREAVGASIDKLRAAGVRTVEVDLPHSRIDVDEAGTLSSFAVACYYVVCTAEASSNLARYDGVHYGHRTAEATDDIVELYSASRDEALGAEVKRRIMLGTYALSSGYYDAYYNRALKVRRLIADDFASALKQCDVILTPTCPNTAFPIGQMADDPLQMYLQDVYTISVNLAGLPAISLPCGLDSGNLPIGLQLIGPVLGEQALLRAAAFTERTLGCANLAPPSASA
jgi:aspartyl-tRNA(Asn)/glutamyl-tRNA(Gln) amidotransferase subunit A